MRVSNFLLWQIAYAEIFVTETLWPDFNRARLSVRVAGVSETRNAATAGFANQLSRESPGGALRALIL